MLYTWNSYNIVCQLYFHNFFKKMNFLLSYLNYLEILTYMHLFLYMKYFMGNSNNMHEFAYV